jgi:hypothetical protein
MIARHDLALSMELKSARTTRHITLFRWSRSPFLPGPGKIRSYLESALDTRYLDSNRWFETCVRLALDHRRYRPA